MPDGTIVTGEVLEIKGGGLTDKEKEIVKEIEGTTVRDFIERFPKKDIGFIFDRGFSSYGLLDDLREDGIHYIVPLRKNSTLIDLRWMRWKESFLYRGRPIRWVQKGLSMAPYSLLKTLCLRVKKNRRSSGKWKRMN